jgi:hypothetical protein
MNSELADSIEFFFSSFFAVALRPETLGLLVHHQLVSSARRGLQHLGCCWINLDFLP